MRGDELLQLADELRVTAQRELGVDPSLDRREPDLLEPLDRGPCERLVREIGERAPRQSPSASRNRSAACCAAPRASLRRSLRQPLEAMQVELLGARRRT